MVKSFRVKADDREHALLRKKIRDRCIECWIPDCWLLKDPKDDGQLYLSKSIAGKKNERVQMRRMLFLSVYGQLPVGRTIQMLCRQKQCLNPAHMTAKGFRHPYEAVSRMIEAGYLTTEQAEMWYKDET